MPDLDAPGLDDSVKQISPAKRKCRRPPTAVDMKLIGVHVDQLAAHASNTQGARSESGRVCCKFFMSGARKVRMRFIPPLLVLFAVVACDVRAVPGTTRAYAFGVSAQSDPGEPLAGIALVRDGKVVATSDSSGLMQLELLGREGVTLRLDVKCPAGHQAQEPTLAVALRRYVDGARPRLTVACPPLERSLALVVRAPLARGMPLVHRGRTLANLDGDGVAHVLLRGAPGDSFEVTLATESEPRMRPTSPGAHFALGDTDRVTVYEPHLELKAAPPVVHRRRRAAPAPTGPQRIR